MPEYPWNEMKTRIEGGENLPIDHTAIIPTAFTLSDISPTIKHVIDVCCSALEFLENKSRGPSSAKS